ncbi:MAG: branched-chain amino acid ABC transporter permease [Proteobacteria bacterium]|nr:branched-chain amino acid ABC transporter permease [Pseudomonadota bacterium]
MRRALTVGVLLLAIAFPLAMQAIDQTYYVTMASRILVYALAATSLNLILGYGGMISFGHAAFVGAGAYTASIMIAEGMPSAWIGWPLAMAVPALLALAIGAISLRTRGVYFIMITLAFAQMIYYLTVSMKAYGGDEGLTLTQRATLGFGLDLKDDATFYYVVLAILVAALFLVSRLVNARFGRVVQAIRENESRMEAIGYPTLRYKLIAFVLAGALGGLAGALLANQNSYVNPGILHWTESGKLMIMVILGGVGHLYGGVFGAIGLLGLEEVLANHKFAWLAALYPDYQQHSLLGVGVAMLAVVLYAPQGIAGLFRRGKDG